MSKEPTSIVGNWLRGFAPLREPQARLVLAAFILMFSWTSFFTMVTGLTDSSSVVSFNVGRGSAALFFALVVRLRRFSRDVRWGAVPYPLAVLTCLTLPLVAVFGQGWPVAALVASFFGGFATIWVSLECFYVLSSLGTRSALVTLMFSLLVSALFRPVIFCAPQGAMCAVVTTFPIASLFLCRRACDAELLARDRSTQRIAHLGKVYWPAIIEIALLGLIVGIIRTPFEENQYTFPAVVYVALLCVLVPLALLVWLSIKGARVKVISFAQVTMIIIVTALLVLFFVDDSSGDLTKTVVTTARLAVHTLLLFVLCELATRSPQHPYSIFGIGMAIFSFSTALGMIVVPALHLSTISTDIAFILSYLLVIGTSFLSSHMSEESGYFIEDQATGVNQVLFDYIDAACERVGETGCLTNRELEVMKLICKGLSKARIAERLSISENTVRGYAKNVYTKLGVHSRQELLSLIGIE